MWAWSHDDVTVGFYYTLVDIVEDAVNKYVAAGSSNGHSKQVSLANILLLTDLRLI